MERMEHPADGIHHATRPRWVRVLGLGLGAPSVSVEEMNGVFCLRVVSRHRGLHPEQQEEHGSAQRRHPGALPRHLLKHPHVLLRPDADLQVSPRTRRAPARAVLSTASSKETSLFVCVFVCLESLQQVRWTAGTAWACVWTTRRGRSHFKEIRLCVFPPTVR